MVKKTVNLKKIIDTPREVISLYDFEGTLGHLENLVAHWVEEYGKDARLDYAREGYTQYSDSPQFQILVRREETDEEYEKRVIEERRWTANREEQDRQEYERLSKKFGVKNA